jgi:hypothetical protein
MNFEVNGTNYASTKLPVLSQLHLARRIAPALGAIASAQADGATTMEGFAGPIMNAVAGMPETDVNWIVTTCLSVVQKLVEGSPPISLAKGGHIMDDSIPLPDVLQIVGKVVQENLGGFFASAGTSV